MATAALSGPCTPGTENTAVILGTAVHAPCSAAKLVRSSSKFKRIAVFCGASDGASPCFAEAARALGRAMAARNIQLVYGGGSVGLMGVISKTACHVPLPVLILLRAQSLETTLECTTIKCIK